jgi:hypothetical protein
MKVEPMTRVSFRRIGITLLVVIGLARLDKVLATISIVYCFAYDSFDPLRRCPVEWQYVVMLLIFALVYLTVFKLLYRRK